MPDYYTRDRSLTAGDRVIVAPQILRYDYSWEIAKGRPGVITKVSTAAWVEILLDDGSEVSFRDEEIALIERCEDAWRDEHLLGPLGRDEGLNVQSERQREQARLATVEVDPGLRFRPSELTRS